MQMKPYPVLNLIILFFMLRGYFYSFPQSIIKHYPSSPGADIKMFFNENEYKVHQHNEEKNVLKVKFNLSYRNW